MLNVNEIFNQRTCYKFSDKPIEESLLKEIYNLVKLGPTSFNCCPLRITFVKSMLEKEKLYRCLMPVNVAKSQSAPIIALFAYDLKFFESFDILFPLPQKEEVRSLFTSSEDLASETAYRNSTLQAAYFMILARSFGLDCGPMSGFDANSVNREFFTGTNFKINFICNLGYKEGDNPFPRLPRFKFEECAKII